MKRIKSYEQFTNENANLNDKEDIVKCILDSCDDYTKEELDGKTESELSNIYHACCSSKVDEGFKDFIKKAVGQLKEWKLDGSYLSKASEDAKSYIKKHPAAKVLIETFKKNGLDQQKAEEAALRCYDSDIRSLNGYKIEYSNETNVLSLALPKGSMNPSIGSI